MAHDAVPALDADRPAASVAAAACPVAEDRLTSQAAAPYRAVAYEQAARAADGGRRLAFAEAADQRVAVVQRHPVALTQPAAPLPVLARGLALHGVALTLAEPPDVRPSERALARLAALVSSGAAVSAWSGVALRCEGAASAGRHVRESAPLLVPGARPGRQALRAVPAARRPRQAVARGAAVVPPALPRPRPQRRRVQEPRPRAAASRPVRELPPGPQRPLGAAGESRASPS